jgi:predicted nuclease of predicted toxin-antitoxin system
MTIRFLIDECLSPYLAITAKQHGYAGEHAVRLDHAGDADGALMGLALKREDILVTNNARDFKRIYRRLVTHPGLVLILPSVNAARQIILFRKVIAFIEAQPAVIDQMVTVRRDGTITIEPWPPIPAGETTRGS